MGSLSRSCAAQPRGTNGAADSISLSVWFDHERLVFPRLPPRPVKEAIVTIGGVALDEVDPQTMESRLAPHLFFAGEVLDIDAITGGFNLQAAWSTAYMVASAINQKQ